MKKLIVVITLFAMLMSASMPALADETMKSLYTDEEIASQLRESDDDIVITLYYGSYMWGFSKRMKVEDIPERNLNEYMRITSKGEFYYYRYIDGQLTRLSIIPGIDLQELYKYAISPELVFGTEVQVYDVLCLLTLDPYTEGMYIYYKTSNGDYALYKHSEEDEEYLLPLQELYGLADAFQEEIRAHSGVMGAGEINIEEVYDLAPYRFKGKIQLEDQGVHWGLYTAIVAVAVVGIGTMCLVVHRKKKK